MSPHPAALLRVENLERRFGGVRAVDGTSFEVRDGSITGLIGPNGAGKSTVVGVVAGAMKPTGGSVLFEGAEIGGLPAHKVARRGIVRTFQSAGEFAKLTVLENLLVAAPHQDGERWVGALRGKRFWREQQAIDVAEARHLLERFDMRDKADEYAGTLSGGQKRLCEIMRAMMAKPRLLVLDEPMSGVNPTLARRIEAYLAGLNADGLTMLMVEHDLALVERLCGAVIVMAHGKVISEGTMTEVRTREEVIDAYVA